MLAPLLCSWHQRTTKYRLAAAAAAAAVAVARPRLWQRGDDDDACSCCSSCCCVLKFVCQHALCSCLWVVLRQARTLSLPLIKRYYYESTTPRSALFVTPMHVLRGAYAELAENHWTKTETDYSRLSRQTSVVVSRSSLPSPTTLHC